MKSVNDRDILKLKQEVINQKKSIEKIERFIPVTNCQIEHHGIKYNIHVLTKQQLILLLVELQALFIAATNLNYVEECVISGYKLSEWLFDIQSKINILSLKERKLVLQRTEEKLNGLLSKDTQTEIEIGDIKKMLFDCN